MTDKVVVVICVQREGDPRSERFIAAVTDLAGSVQLSLPLVESDVRRELVKFGFPDGVIDDYIEKSRAFKTTTTTNDWWSGMFGRP